jgi:hypothetical protein
MEAKRPCKDNSSSSTPEEVFQFAMARPLFSWRGHAGANAWKLIISPCLASDPGSVNGRDRVRMKALPGER